jgi:triacylglycerol esterase/lipase EstA (alpha/beta hydrolase family)
MTTHYQVYQVGVGSSLPDSNSDWSTAMTTHYQVYQILRMHKALHLHLVCLHGM